MYLVKRILTTTGDRFRCSSFLKSIEWSTRSKALLASKKQPWTVDPLLQYLDITFLIRPVHKSVEKPCLKPNYCMRVLLLLLLLYVHRILASYIPRPRRGREKSGPVSNVCACAEITKKTGNRILSVNSSYYGTVYVHL